MKKTVNRIVLFMTSVIFVFAAHGEVEAQQRRVLKTPRAYVPSQRVVDIDHDRLVVLEGIIDHRSAAPVIRAFTKLDEVDPTLPIYFIINSPGGSVVAGAGVMQAVESVSAPTVCIVETAAYSMAALISAYCDKVFMHKYAMMMFHEASYGVSGSESQIRTQVSAIQSYLDQIFGDVAIQLGVSLPAFRKMIKNDLWMTAREAVRWGFADGIVRELKYTKPADGQQIPVIFGQDEFEDTEDDGDLYYMFILKEDIVMQGEGK